MTCYASITSSILVAGVGAAAGLGVGGYTTIISGLLNFGAVGMLAAVLFYIYHQQRKDHKELIDTLRRDHREDKEFDREQYARSITQLIAGFREHDEARQRAIDELRTDHRSFREETRNGFEEVSRAINEMRYTSVVSTDTRFREATVKQNEVLVEEEHRRKSARPKGGQ